MQFICSVKSDFFFDLILQISQIKSKGRFSGKVRIRRLLSCKCNCITQSTHLENCIKIFFKFCIKWVEENMTF